MGYDPYTEARTDSWTWEAQCALWRERALHQAQNAERWKRIAQAAEALHTGAAIKEPKL